MLTPFLPTVTILDPGEVTLIVETGTEWKADLRIASGLWPIG